MKINFELFAIRANYIKDFPLTLAKELPRAKSLNVEFSKSIADAFDEMNHDPKKTETRLAYSALCGQLTRQFAYLSNNGYKCKIWQGEGEPYASSDEMRHDLHTTKSIYIFPTLSGFGSDNQQSRDAILDNPLLEKTDFYVEEYRLCVNDLFRFVHDVFGHGVQNNQFGQLGEERAWACHLPMFSIWAARALTTETRGQNSWVNFGKHLRDENGKVAQSIREKGYIHPSQRPYAAQKIGLLPDWCMNFEHHY